MQQRPIATLAASLIVGAAGSHAHAAIYYGVEFPLGEISFADRVHFYEPGPGVAAPQDNPEAALGAPDYVNNANDRYVALGHGGTLIVEFIDNRLVDQDEVENGADLYIFEVGGQVESFHVAISIDGTDYIELGTVAGQPTAIDIKPFIEPGQAFRFVRLIDANSNRSQSPWAGADIDAVGAIGAVIPEPASAMLALAGSAALVRRRR